jgi:hypothetical protein
MGEDRWAGIKDARNSADSNVPNSKLLNQRDSTPTITSRLKHCLAEEPQICFSLARNSKEDKPSIGTLRPTLFADKMGAS